MDDGVTLDILQQLHRHVAGHLMRRIQSRLQRRIEDSVDLCHGLFDRVSRHIAVDGHRKGIAFRSLDGQFLAVVSDLDAAGRKRVRFLDIRKKRDDLGPVFRRRDRIGKGGVADIVNCGYRNAYRVRIIILCSRIGIGNRIQAIAADGKERGHGEDAAQDGELGSVSRKRAGVFTGFDDNLAAGCGCAYKPFSAAEGVIIQRHSHPAGIFNSYGIAFRSNCIAGDGSGSVSAADVDAVLDTAHSASGNCKILYTNKLSKTMTSSYGQVFKRNLVCAGA